MSEKKYTGGCRCKKIRYEFTTEKLSSAVCACLDCQKSSGAIIIHAVGVKNTNFKITQGHDYLKYYADTGDSGKAVRRYFCSECGSQLYANPQGYPELISLRVPSLDNFDGKEPNFAIYTRNIPHWITLPEHVIEEGKNMEDSLGKLSEIIEENRKRKNKALSHLEKERYSIDSQEIQGCLKDLESKEDFELLQSDPYWPKWNSPWWKMLLLYEMGLGKIAPKRTMRRLLESARDHYIDFFPLVESEIPKGVDPYRNIPCHCALGALYKMLSEFGFSVDKEIPWIRDWFLKYQLPDGGLNCEESVYTKEVARSSFLSTIAPMEAILFYGNEHTEQEKMFLKQGFQYFIKRKLYLSISKKKIINKKWLYPCFPRYYEYDILRGLSFVVSFAKKFQEKIEASHILDVVHILHQNLQDGKIIASTNDLISSRTLYEKEKGLWMMKEVDIFPLLQYTTQNAYYLTKEWYDIIEWLFSLKQKKLLI